MSPCATRKHEFVDVDYVLATQNGDFLTTQDGAFILLYSSTDAIADCAPGIWMVEEEDDG